jgi:multimeric flavodoxin WrbA
MKIKVLGICASPVRGGNTQAFLEKCLEAAGGEPQVEVQMVTLAEKKIGSCKHCNWCLSKQTQDLFCIQRDDMDEIYPLVADADALALATPVYIGRLSGYLASLMDRLRAFVYGKVHRGRLADKVAGALAVGWYRHAGLETALQSIVAGIFTLGMIPVATPHCPWGAAGLSSKGGTGEFQKSVRLGVLEDSWGVEAAQALGKRMVYLARKMKAVAK